MQQETRNCQNCKNQFVIEPEDFDFYEKIKVPPPTWCPECRLKRRLMWRNERSFHHRICEKCGKKIISVFSKESEIHTYCQSCWPSDSWDGLEYSRDFDPSRPFLEQLKELFHSVPIMNLYGIHSTNVNSDYTNMVGWLKNCYMVTYSDHGENNIYGSFVNYCKDSVDNLMANNCELCYETVNCTQCYRTFFSIDCESCSDVLFSKNLSGCNNCFGCVNLRNKSYHIFNKPCSKEEYEKKIADLYPLTQEKIKEAWNKSKDIWEKAPQKYIHGWHIIASSGDYLNDTKNAKSCFIGFNIEDSRYCSFVTGKLTDARDFTNFGKNSSLLCETLQCGDQVSKIKFSWLTLTNSQDIEYSMFIVNSKDLFGCVGMRKHQYCILNKQYTKEEYVKLRQEIIEQMKQREEYGEFFPIQMSPFCYNETTAQEFFPLTKAQALSQGYQWKDPEVRNYQIDITSENLLDHIKDVDESIIGKVIECAHKGECKEQCATAFKIIKEELQFYKNMNLPLPRLCPNCRHYQRLKQRNPMKLWQRKCNCAGAKSESGIYQNSAEHFHKSGHCPNEFETSYAPERPEIVYCGQCYNAEVV